MSDRSAAYRQMTENWAWKDFMKTMDEARRSALEAAVYSSEIEQVILNRGIVKCIDALKSDVDLILEEGQ